MPYQPPPGPPAGPPDQPSSVALAVKLMYAGAVLTVITSLISLFTISKDDVREEVVNRGSSMTASQIDQAVSVGYAMGIAVAIFSIIVVTALWIVMATFNGKGMNWARITATVLGVLSVILTLFGLTQEGSGLNKGISLLSPILGIVVLVLLWKKESSQFYEQAEVARARGNA